MEAVGLLLLFFAAVSEAKGADCPVSSPQCYRGSTQPDEDIFCEWEDQDTSQEATYILHIQNSLSGSNDFNTGREQREKVPLEYVFITSPSNIWVERRNDNSTCNSQNISVMLNESVKYSAPHIEKKIRSAGNLTLSWSRAKDKKGAIYEIRWRETHSSWRNVTFTTEESEEDKLDSYSLPLKRRSVCHVQVRRKAIHYNLWSDWSSTVDVPVEIQAPDVKWREERKGHWRIIKLNWSAPTPEASIGGISYNLTVKLPCKTMKKTTKQTSYELKVTDSEVNLSVIAINDVSKSTSRNIIIPPVPHLQYCFQSNNSNSVTLPQRKHFCLEWYELIDGKTRTSSTNVLTSRQANRFPEEIKKKMKEFVRYYYFVHVRHKKNWHTQSSCPIYSKEGEPDVPPEKVTVNLEHKPPLLSWKPIPVQKQRGFVLHYVIWISSEGSNTAYFEVPGNTSSLLLRNLTAGMSYTVNITGRTKAGEGPKSTIDFSGNTIPVSNNSLAKIILTVCGLLLVFSVFLSVILRRLRKKLLPVIPSPVIPDTAFYPHQNMKMVTEEVHDVILLYSNDLYKHSTSPETSTLLPDCQLSVCEEEQEEEEEDEVHCPNAFPNPNYKGQMLRIPELLEITEETQNNICEVHIPSYRHGSVL